MGTCKLCRKSYSDLQTHLDYQHDYMALGVYKIQSANLPPISETPIKSGYKRPVTWGNKISKAKKGRIFELAGWNRGLTAETNDSVAKIANNEIRTEKIRQANIGREITWADKISATKKAQFQDPEYLRQMMSNFGNRKTKPEIKLENILSKFFPNQWLYCGDGSVCIKGKSPDFINVDGKKQVLEVFGRYWHKNEDVQIRIEMFASFGFATLVFWEDELDNESTVTEKIKNFPSVET